MSKLGLFLALTLSLISKTLLYESSYHIAEGRITSYFYRHFSIVDEDIFPSVLRIQMSLSRISGTLLYSLDRHKNQLIITLQESHKPILEVEFRNVKQSLLFEDLCFCESCKYRDLDLEIKIRNKEDNNVEINLNCNNVEKELNYYGEKKLNKNFPIVYSEDQFSNVTQNEAQLWLVNTPSFRDITPNNKQLSGCIFKVDYNNAHVEFNETIGAITKKCTKICSPNICNKGQCLETFTSRPICNCTTTFHNGEYCNDTMKPINVERIKVRLQFQMLKVSFQSSMNEIIAIENTKVKLHLYYLGCDLVFEYCYKHGFNTYIAKGNISRNYSPNIKSVLIVEFHEKSLHIHFYNNKLWNFSSLIINRDLNEEIFTLLTLRSGVGIIDMVYKGYFTWNKLNLKELRKYNKSQKIKVFNKNKDNSSDKGWLNLWFLLIIIPLMLLSTVFIVLFIKERGKHSPQINIPSTVELETKKPDQEILLNKAEGEMIEPKQNISPNQVGSPGTSQPSTILNMEEGSKTNLPKPGLVRL